MSSHRMTGRIGVWDKLWQGRLEGKICVISGGGSIKGGETGAGGLL